MTSYVNDMWPGSPQRKDPPAGAGTGRCSRLASRSRSSSSSASSRAVSPRSERSSGSRSRSPSRRRRSRSQSRRRHQRKYRRYSRSYSRSRSRSRGRRYRERLPPRGSRRSPSRSRSRSRGRSRSRRPAPGPRGRRCYGLGRTLYPEPRPGWRSRSHTPLRLSDKDRMELLEIAKANAAKALGTTNIDLPASLKTGLLSKDANYGKQIQSDATKLELSGRFNEDVIKTSSESSSLQRNLPFSSGNSVANPVLQKTTKETARSPKDDEKSQSSYGQWIPVKKEENSLLLSSKTTLSFKF
ncbi:arginine/serine-rich protein 1 [Sarcophilus harrisii]|uniref:Arginine/serine-rich protein 1 n=1 Tax=Sarcophilus harrisii TaxID=9305 RepID=A0A7N4UXQ5_SARHA|nr:arginine/serine-rich protein 1 [Sarcophilus harrisii]